MNFSVQVNLSECGITQLRVQRSTQSVLHNVLQSDADKWQLEHSFCEGEQLNILHSMSEMMLWQRRKRYFFYYINIRQQYKNNSLHGMKGNMLISKEKHRCSVSLDQVSLNTISDGAEQIYSLSVKKTWAARYLGADGSLKSSISASTDWDSRGQRFSEWLLRQLSTHKLKCLIRIHYTALALRHMCHFPN